jgi:hypothetical protein|tara:strand:- start:172 stop:573 length:402 start_codon:yes stop_codon:yes gene_type:complete
MINNKRRTFRPRQQKSGFRRRNGPSNHNQNGHFSNGNTNFNRNGSMTNPVNVEKTIQKFQQLAKDAQSSGDPVLVENYLQHADHYARRLAELNLRSQASQSTLDNSTKEVGLKSEKLSNSPEKKEEINLELKN